MKKRVFGRKFSRDRGSRKALFRSLIRAMVLNQKIVTTHAKAKAIQGDLDGLLRDVNENSIAAKRRVLASLGNDRVTTEILFRNFLPVSQTRQSGYTRIISLPPRKGDLAKMARLEWVDTITQQPKPEAKPKIKKTDSQVEKSEPKAKKTAPASSKAKSKITKK
jgi:large subunit ribosomal protein L17